MRTFEGFINKWCFVDDMWSYNLLDTSGKYQEQFNNWLVAKAVIEEFPGDEGPARIHGATPFPFQIDIDDIVEKHLKEGTPDRFDVWGVTGHGWCDSDFFCTPDRGAGTKHFIDGTMGFGISLKGEYRLLAVSSVALPFGWQSFDTPPGPSIVQVQSLKIGDYKGGRFLDEEEGRVLSKYCWEKLMAGVVERWAETETVFGATYFRPAQYSTWFDPCPSKDEDVARNKRMLIRINGTAKKMGYKKVSTGMNNEYIFVKRLRT